MTTETHAFLPRFELKFRVLREQAPALRCWLEHGMAPDPRYPRGRVNSLYFDTLRLALHAEKVNSDYRKTKVRLRWYGASPGPDENAFLEVKEKFGSEIRKVRRPAGGMKQDGSGASPFSIDADAVSRAARELCADVPARLLPVCVISYERQRLMDTRTGWRVALDSELSIPWCNADLLPAAGPAALSGAILEVKGRGLRPRLPDHYLPYDGVRILPESFSKYGQAVRRVFFNEGLT